MQQNQFVLRHGLSKELELFPQIKEFSLQKSTAIQLDSFKVDLCDSLLFVYIVDGKFDWVINQQHHALYPGDTAIVLPGQKIGGSKGYLDIGTIICLYLKVECLEHNRKITLGNWCNLSDNESAAVGKILLHNNLAVLKVREVPGILQEIRSEILTQEIGYITRVNHLLNSLIIVVARQSTRQSSSRRDFPQAFMKLEQALRQNLAHQWTVEEMAAMVGLGTTAFTEKVKSFTGFPPLNYLINIRISEAMKLLKRQSLNVTDIALETGFYSSQHFSTTFKKLTGQTPGEFRKKSFSTSRASHE